ncbi:galactosyltransferase-related protein [Marinobacter sp. ATCH36]|uniref:glycosyltransferase family 2 protein n=1 Tax=Marinobacter sp. ATCH36 TaxID=2945106 RepID=UPI00202005DE|nr:galactosyltransferase-related protein [Marinobacter sp. ATCH36]MCL7945397.1 galactosyltransferase-related protein [Marinobacter sp. ATCH36]
MTNAEHRPAASVLTLVRGRQAHLDALIEGLKKQTCLNIELVIASMQPEPPVVSSFLPFPVSIIYVPGARLPLAAARNATAAQARSDRLIFLDVDCIPSPTLVESYIEQLHASGCCLLGEVRYLPGTLPQDKTGLSFSDLAAHAKPHPARPCLQGEGWFHEPDPRALWGLSFAVTRSQYQRAGGMDEEYLGYGGEETDFAEQLAAASVRLAWCGNALALHQHHPMHSPPLDRFDDILGNAIRFHDKWGSWCMEYWLDYFVDYGLIEWSSTTASIKVIRQPTQADIQACLQPPEVAFA